MKNDEIAIEDLLSELRTQIGNLSQEIAILKIQIRSLTKDLDT